jgi:hypothetical protein
MSNAALTAARKITAGGPANKTVLNCLADHANERGECWPSIPTIAEETELSERTVQRSLADLEKRELVERQARPYGSTHARNSDLYRLPWCHGDTTPGDIVTPPGDTVTSPPRHSVTTPGDMVSPKALVEASKKPKEVEAPQASPSPAHDDSPKATKRSTTPLTRLSADWKLPDEWRGYARTLGLDDRQADYVAANFLDHWLQQPDSKGRKKDWYAAWRIWVRREIEFKRGVGNIPRAQASATTGGHAKRLYWADGGSERWNAWDRHFKAQGKSGAIAIDGRPKPDGSFGGNEYPVRQGWYFESSWPPPVVDQHDDLKQAA